MIGNTANYPEYSVDFDKASAKQALNRGDSLFTDDTDPPAAFDCEFLEKRTFKAFEPATAARTCFIVKGKPTEVFELIYRMSCKLA